MACPVPVIERWKAITGHPLLERYGMTELGMVLSQSLHGPRHAGYVGHPLPSVQVQVERGELKVRGPGVFEGYWGQDPHQGWFYTGDMVSYDPEKGYKILGRMSVDIIKSGGYKLSALEIEAAMLEMPQVAECFVLGEPDEKWGQLVLAVIRLYESVSRESLDTHARTKLADYKVPRKYVIVSEIPKNAMGKVNKKCLLASIGYDAASPGDPSVGRDAP